jgi:hypothetical protein
VSFLKLLPWDIWTVAAVAVAAVIFAITFGQLSLLVLALIGLALVTYIAIRIWLFDLG